MFFTKLTERQQLGSVIIGAIVVLFSLWFFLLRPQYARLARLEREIEKRVSLLNDRELRHDEEYLRSRLNDERKRGRELRRQWEKTANRLTGFPEQHVLASAKAARIDYKTALFDVDRRLRDKSEKAGIPLPHALGMTEAVTTHEDTRSLMLQLRAAERLADLALDLKIAEIKHIEPLEPVRHTADGDNIPWLEEFPVRIIFRGTTANLRDLFRAVLMPDHFFCLRRLRIDRLTVTDSADHLHIDMVLSALFFEQDIGIIGVFE